MTTKPHTISVSLGFSLLEILIVLCIITLLSSIAILNLNTWACQLEQTLTLNKLMNAIEFARNEAFRLHKTISLCPSADQKYCYVGDDWSKGFIIFENPERDTQPKANSILKFFTGTSRGKISFDALGNELHIRPNGNTTNYGKFCYFSNNDTFTPMNCLIVNNAARTYIK